MAAFAVAAFDINDRSWVREYLANTAALIQRHGGRYLARGSEHETVEGDHTPDVIVILEFPTMDALRGWYDDPEYAPLRDARRAGTTGTFHLVPGDA